MLFAASLSAVRADLVRAELDSVSPPTSLQDWVTSIQDAIHHHTKHLARSEEHPYIYTHLVHLWDKRHHLVQSLKENKTNERLNVVIQNITQVAEDYAHSLTTQNWLDTYDIITDNIHTPHVLPFSSLLLSFALILFDHVHTPRVWQIFRTLLGQTKPRRPLIKLLRNQQSPKIWQATSLSTLTPSLLFPLYPRHCLPQNQALERELILPSASHNFSLSSTTSRNKLPRARMASLTRLFAISLTLISISFFPTSTKRENPANSQKSGAPLKPIPKPGKPPTDANNFRPISLTSCAGKLMEKMVLARLELHADSINAFTPAQTGFRPQVSTQDTAMRIYEDVYQFASTVQLRVIATVDVCKAFDIIPHSAILHNLSQLEVGLRMLNYDRAVLFNRTIQL
ncbi:hypothetical protein ISCGN_016142 [Ixodes scapularis]